MFELPLGASVADMMLSANAMIVLDDYGTRGGAESNLFINDHNPFHVDNLRRAGPGETLNLIPTLLLTLISCVRRCV